MTCNVDSLRADKLWYLETYQPTLEVIFLQEVHVTDNITFARLVPGHMAITSLR